MISLLFIQILYWLSYFKLVVVVDIWQNVANAQIHPSKIVVFPLFLCFWVISTVRINGMLAWLTPLCTNFVTAIKWFSQVENIYYLLIVLTTFNQFISKISFQLCLGWCHTNIIEKNILWKTSQLLKELHVVSLIIAS